MCLDINKEEIMQTKKQGLSIASLICALMVIPLLFTGIFVLSVISLSLAFVLGIAALVAGQRKGPAIFGIMFIPTLIILVILAYAIACSIKPSLKNNLNPNTIKTVLNLSLFSFRSF